MKKSAFYAGICALGIFSFGAHAAYVDEISNDPGLISYYRLGEATGATTAVDETGTNPGTYQDPANTTYQQPGAIMGDPNTAVRFNGSANSYINAGNGASLNQDFAGLTVMGWIAPETTSGHRIIAAKWAQSLAEDHFILHLLQNTNQLVFAVNGSNGTSGGVEEAAVSSAAVPFDEYSFVVGTWDDSGDLAVYINGAPAGSNAGTIVDINQTSDAPLTIGAEASDFRVFVGEIDEVALFDRALSATEVADLYAAALVPEPTGAAMLALGATALLRRRRNA